MTLENVLILMIAAGLLQVAIIKYYFASKRSYMRDVMQGLHSNGEVS